MAIELPWWNTEERAVAELTAVPGARVAAEHMHPAKHDHVGELLRGQRQELDRPQVGRRGRIGMRHGPIITRPRGAHASADRY